MLKRQRHVKGVNQRQEENINLVEMYFLDGNDEWKNIHSSDLWIYNKLFLSRTLGYECGPVGTTVPKPDFYIVRPSFNLLGMGRFARKEWIEKYTDQFHPSEFWCEIFTGEHLSVDFKNKKSELVVLGTRNIDDPYYKWKKWEKIDKKVEFPEILNSLKGDYEWINCEFINESLIEVHFRQNPDFRYQNSIAIPVWEDTQEENMTFISDNDYLRRGFYIQ
jgi:hypothetical protein